MTPRSATPKRRGRPANTSTDDTVATVLIAARREFAAHGYAGTSNQAMATAAGLTHTVVYNHFGSKAALFTAVFVDVQDRLVEELDRSVRAAPDDPPLPQALLDALDALRAADPSYVEFLASMYTEVRRHADLRAIFEGGQRFPIFELLRELAAGRESGVGPDNPDDAVWFWITFALGLAQLSTLADPVVFADTLQMFRHQFATLKPGTVEESPTAGGDMP